MEIITVGVVGAGTMGHGIAQVMVRAGHRVLLLDISQDFVEAGAKRIAKGLARDVEKARMTAGRARAGAGAAEAHDRGGGPCRSRFRHRGGDGEVRREGRRLPLARATLPPGGDLRLQHVFHFHHPPRRRNRAPGPLRRPALFQSRARDEVGGGRAGLADGARNRGSSSSSLPLRRARLRCA